MSSATALTRKARSLFRQATEGVVGRIQSILAHRGSLALIDQGVVSGANFVTTLTIARVCGKAELGLYIAAWTALYIVNEILSALITVPFVINNPTVPESSQARYRGSVVIHQLLGSSIAAAAVGMAGIVLYCSGRTGAGKLLGTIAGLLVALLFRDFSRRMWFANLQMKAAVVSDCAAAIIQLLLLGILAITGELRAVTAYLVIAAAATIPSVQWISSHKRRVTLRVHAAVVDFRTNWKLARWITSSGALWAVASYTYPWILIWSAGPATTGIWAAYYGVVALSNPVLLGVGNYLGPRIAILQGHSGTMRMRQYVYRSSVGFACLLSPIALALWCFGNVIVRHLYGAAYTGHAAVIRLLAVNVLLVGVMFSFTRGLFVLQRPDLDTYVNIGGAVILLCAGIPLVHWFGITGSAIGLSVTSAVTLILRIVLFSRISSSYRQQPVGAPDVVPQNA